MVQPPSKPTTPSHGAFHLDLHHCKNHQSSMELPHLHKSPLIYYHHLQKPRRATFHRQTEITAQPTTLPLCPPLVPLHHRRLLKPPRAAFDLQTKITPSMWTTLLSLSSRQILPLLFNVIIFLILSHITH